MQARATLRPGQKGTKKLVERFGTQLIYVRYRYDARQRKRFTTVELIVDETAWDPPPPPPDRLALVRIAWDEVDLRDRVKAAGGRWDRERRLWLLPASQVKLLGLQRRVLPAQ
jgi:hypothetical protein